ncbi:hypothetical protein LTR70_003524 [Exophiala xenobiotica]|uniref:Enoyl reductase (ER) domain-containing protein n=1 Tax=Lithohypha guttulata TaxID=1690604 RepID=A0ABR0KFU5_9EURO|nr:hypothetical protein LTR24_003072 [Lithohypha guttulata]KAK5322904.1 hypothetical protein LTR70_003524 [Exophiala xenobiotica]
MTTTLPKTMRAWQYATVTNGFENSLKLNTSAPLPTPKQNQHLIKISSVSLNPVDYKPAEIPLFRRIAIANPATPGIDFAGTIVTPAKGSNLKSGDTVFGCGPSPFAGGCLAEYAVAGTDSTVRMPEGLSMEHASTIGIAGVTAYQSIAPHISKSGGSRVFINGGSGGTGVFGIQIAKALDCDVITTCSGRNVELCRSLGADEVVDYTKNKDLAGALAKTTKDNGKKVDHIVDNVGADLNLFYKAHEYSGPNAMFLTIAGDLSLRGVLNTLKMRLWPGWLGGGKRRAGGLFAKINVSELDQVAKWMAEGKVKPVVDDRFSFEDVPKAFEKLKTGRARGKIVVAVQGGK